MSGRGGVGGGSSGRSGRLAHMIPPTHVSTEGVQSLPLRTLQAKSSTGSAVQACQNFVSVSSYSPSQNGNNQLQQLLRTPHLKPTPYW